MTSLEESRTETERVGGRQGLEHGWGQGFGVERRWQFWRRTGGDMLNAGEQNTQPRLKWGVLR